MAWSEYYANIEAMVMQWARRDHNASKRLKAVALAVQQVQQQGTRRQTDSAHQKFQDLLSHQTDYKKVLEDELDLGCA